MVGFLVWLRTDDPSRIPGRRLLFIEEPSHTRVAGAPRALWYPVSITVLDPPVMDVGPEMDMPPPPPPSPPLGNGDDGDRRAGAASGHGDLRLASASGRREPGSGGSSVASSPAPPQGGQVQQTCIQISHDDQSSRQLGPEALSSYCARATGDNKSGIPQVLARHVSPLPVDGLADSVQHGAHSPDPDPEQQASSGGSNQLASQAGDPREARGLVASPRLVALSRWRAGCLLPTPTQVHLVEPNGSRAEVETES